MLMRQAERLALGRHNYDLFLGDPEEEFIERMADGSFFPSESDLDRLFDDLNWKYFDGNLPKIDVRWSLRMKHAGRYCAEERSIKLGHSYHKYYPEDIIDTLKHEMIHLRQPNHGREFKKEAGRIGASLYARNYPGMLRGMKYLYECPECGTTYPSRKMLRNRSCGQCSKGKYDSRFKLRFVRRVHHEQ